nr:lysophospholipase [Rhizobium setariae]
MSLPVGALELKAYKDSLFAYPAILSQEDGGGFVTVDYQEIRDINGRDEIPERRAKSRYVSLGVKRQQAFETVEADGRSIDVLRVGEVKNARFAVIFIHGRGGDRKLGANDFSFGGNFNRLKNLAVDNQGVYYAASVRSFDAEGVADISALISHIARVSPNTRVVLSCASMGSFVCWGISKDAQAVGKLAGMMIMGGATDPNFGSSVAHKARLPMFFSHGSRDSVYAAADQVKLYKSLFAERYPTRFVLFETGSHGTPVRMTDWRDSLNWILR